MEYKNFKDFLKRKEEIKKEFDKNFLDENNYIKNSDSLKEYKMYVYSKEDRYYEKDFIWEYLNYDEKYRRFDFLIDYMI